MFPTVVNRTKLIVRNANPSDKMRLAGFLHEAQFIHRHLDWRPPLDWVGWDPFLVLEISGKLAATLSCPAHPPKVAWIRLFGVANDYDPHDAWFNLWNPARQSLEGDGNNFTTESVAALPLDSWLRVVLEESGFQQVTEVVVLKVNDLDNPGLVPEGIIIRPMRSGDVEAVGILDAAAFEPLWHQPGDDLELAFRQSSVSTVAERNGDIVGYQITTPSHFGGHLARLAVHPSQHGRGIGKGLVGELMKQMRLSGAHGLTVNTQSNNQASLALYHKFGFIETGDRYPVFQRLLRGFRG